MEKNITPTKKNRWTGPAKLNNTISVGFPWKEYWTAGVPRNVYDRWQKYGTLHNISVQTFENSTFTKMICYIEVNYCQLGQK